MFTNNHERRHQRFRRKNFKRWSLDMYHLLEWCIDCGEEERLQTRDGETVCTDCVEPAPA